MKFKISILVYFISIVYVFPQKKDIIEFVGAITTADREIISYKISFEEKENGNITGISTSDFYGKNITKSNIVGSIDHEKNRISFKEINNISTKSTEDDSLFCYIQISNLKIRTVKGKKIINGSFMGKFPNGKDCANGNIYLVTADIIDDIRSNMDKLNVSEDSLRKLLLNTPSNPVKTLKKDDKLTIYTKNKKIILDVWDGNIEDGDIINIYYNQEIVKENLLITNKKQKIIIPFKDKKGTILIKAIDEGSTAPNTVNFVLINGKVSKPFISKLFKNEKVSVDIIRQSD